MKGYIILKLQTPADFQESNQNIKIRKLISTISTRDFIKLLNEADNKVNPRSAKANKITKSIHETLEFSPELFWLKTKGILLATERCEVLDRNRVRVSLEDTDFEGIMDGGHNTFAIASFITDRLFGKKFKDWEECKEFWETNYEDILSEYEKNIEIFPDFSIPIEIICPNDEDGSLDQYYDFIAEICSARNNNVQLTEVAKGNQVGLYDHLKENLDGRFEVIWKTGEEGNIKSEDVISMATIPLLFLQELDRLPEGIAQLNPISIYSQKSKCVDFFNAVLGNNEISSEDKGKHILKDELVSSGLNLVEDILYFFDKIFVNFPNLYNRVSPGFGRIKSVNDKKTKHATFRTGTSEYVYPPGFIYPLVTGILELIEIDETNNHLRWKVSPRVINLEKLDMGQYVEAIKLVNYDPQTVGKQALFYKLARSIFEEYVRNYSDRNFASAVEQKSALFEVN